MSAVITSAGCAMFPDSARSVLLVITYTLNPFRMLDVGALRRQPHHLRLTALVDQRLEQAFAPYESLFDYVYYLDVEYTNHCFVEAFSDAATDAVARELTICRGLKLLSFFEGDIEATAKLRDSFDLPGMGSNEARRFRDKLTMKQQVSAHHHDVPRALKLDWALPAEATFSRCVSELGIPFVIKPIALGGSLGVTRVASFEQFEGCRHRHLDAAYMAEEEITGDLLHLDMVVNQGNPSWFGCSQYNLTTLAFAQGRPVGSMPLLPDDPSYCALRDYASDIRRSLSVHDGIVHIEVFRRNDKIYFIEAAARASGGLATLVYHKMFGYNMIQAMTDYQVGLAYEPRCPDGLAYFWLLLPDGVDVRPRLLDLEIQYELFPPGDGAQIPGSLIGQHARIIAWHEDPAYLHNAFMAIA